MIQFEKPAQSVPRMLELPQPCGKLPKTFCKCFQADQLNLLESLNFV